MKIIHVFRAPIGGLFRHVSDLVNGQVERGHQVGIIMDNQIDNARLNEILTTLLPNLALGLERIRMERELTLGDVFALRHVVSKIRRVDADVVHGHGAKGGALVRLAPVPKGTIRVYTPHGGSLHDAVAGKFYLMLERILMRRGDLYLFESQYSHDSFTRKIGAPRSVVRVVHNGVSSAEFEPVKVVEDATDLVFLGELRTLKGVDLLIDAIAILQQQGTLLTATIVGDGPDAGKFREQAKQLGLANAIEFRGAMPTRAALALGKILVLPSRAESMPYVVLEGAAATKPLIATNVGGIQEIYGAMANELVPPDNSADLAQAILMKLQDPIRASQISRAVGTRVATEFSLDAMVDEVLVSYRRALDIVRRTGQPWQLTEIEMKTGTRS